MRKIIHLLKLVDYLHVQADNPWCNYMYYYLVLKFISIPIATCNLPGRDVGSGFPPPSGSAHKTNSQHREEERERTDRLILYIDKLGYEYG